MREVFGVLCKTCEAALVIGDAEPAEPFEADKLVIYTAPLIPVPCPECGSSYIYEDKDVITFQIPDNHP
jgi:endogenous inhibitor of DNA gyrase (YacG/DUF329 family)